MAPAGFSTRGEELGSCLDVIDEFRQALPRPHVSPQLPDRVAALAHATGHCVEACPHMRELVEEVGGGVGDGQFCGLRRHGHVGSRNVVAVGAVLGVADARHHRHAARGDGPAEALVVERA